MTTMKLSDMIDPFIDQARADSVLFEFIDLCYNRHLVYYICFGTALGFYRNKGYLQDDPDINVFISGDKNSRIALFNDLAVNGFVLNAIPGTNPSLNCHTVKNSILLDVWFHQRKDFMAFYQGDNYILYQGRRIRIPTNIEKYLSCIYGDWKSPAKTSANPFEPKH